MASTTANFAASPAASGCSLRDWRCRKCTNLLGKHDGRLLHVRLSRGYSYSACLPATATCRCCGRLNDLPRGSAI